MSLVEEFDVLMSTIPGSRNEMSEKFRKKLVDSDKLFNPKNPVDMCLAYVAAVDGFEGVKTDANTLKISSPYFAGSLLYWPTTNRFRFTDSNEAKKYSWTSDKLGIAEVLLGVSISPPKLRIMLE